MGPCTGIEMGDELWMSRYILLRIAELYNVEVTHLGCLFWQSPDDCLWTTAVKCFLTCSTCPDCMITMHQGVCITPDTGWSQCAATQKEHGWGLIWQARRA